MKKTEFFDYDKYLSSKTNKDNTQDNAQTENISSAESALEKEPEFSKELGLPKSETSSEANNKKTKHSKQSRKKAEKVDAVESIKNAFDSALDEDVAEIAEFSVPKNIDEPPAIKKPSFKRNLYFIIGIAVSFMSLIGFLSSVIFVAGIVRDVAENTKQKEEFAQFIYPVVIVDPATFNSADQLSSDAVISAAIWDIILYGDTSKYPTEFGTMTVPQLDVELNATNLFGPGLTFEHKTLGDAVLSFYYNPDTKSYTVPISPKYFPYSPLIENVKRNGNTYTLKVGYVSPSPDWLVSNKKTKLEPDKYMEYIVKKSNNSYVLTAINELPDEKQSPSEF